MQLSVWMQHQQSEGSHTVMVCQYVATNTDAAFIGTILRWLFFFFYHISLILFYLTSCLPWFYFMLIMSSLIPFSDHHVQLDFIFCPSCPAWFYFCTSCPAWLYVLSPHIMPSQGAQTTLGTTPCQPLSSLSSQSQPKDLFPCILACTPTHKIFH